jgi:hypothetical protein
MTTKLTLTMEDQVIDSAKEYARKKGESLSNIVENYLKSITTQTDQDVVISAKVSKMMGVIKLPENYDYKAELGKAIIKNTNR